MEKTETFERKLVNNIKTLITYKNDLIKNKTKLIKDFEIGKTYYSGFHKQDITIKVWGDEDYLCYVFWVFGVFNKRYDYFNKGNQFVIKQLQLVKTKKDYAKQEYINEIEELVSSLETMVSKINNRVEYHKKKT